MNKRYCCVFPGCTGMFTSLYLHVTLCSLLCYWDRFFYRFTDFTQLRTCQCLFLFVNSYISYRIFLIKVTSPSVQCLITSLSILILISLLISGKVKIVWITIYVQKILNSFSGHYEVAEYLVHQGCNKDKADIYGVCPLHLASMSGDLNTVILLFICKSMELSKTKNKNVWFKISDSSCM